MVTPLFQFTILILIAVTLVFRRESIKDWPHFQLAEIFLMISLAITSLLGAVFRYFFGVSEEYTLVTSFAISLDMIFCVLSIAFFLSAIHPSYRPTGHRQDKLARDPRRYKAPENFKVNLDDEDDEAEDVATDEKDDPSETETSPGETGKKPD